MCLKRGRRQPNKCHTLARSAVQTAKTLQTLGINPTAARQSDDPGHLTGVPSEAGLLEPLAFHHCTKMTHTCYKEQHFQHTGTLNYLRTMFKLSLTEISKSFGTIKKLTTSHAGSLCLNLDANHKENVNSIFKANLAPCASASFFSITQVQSEYNGLT